MSRIHPVVLVLIAIASVQFGAALAKGVFDAAHPATLAFLRAALGGLVFLLIARPDSVGGPGWTGWSRPATGCACPG